MIRSGTIVTLAISALLLCCATLGGSSDADLPKVLDSFHHDVRWQYSNAAAARVELTCAASFVDELEDMKDDLHISAWEVRQIEPDEQKHQAKVRVQISYYKLPSTTLKSETVEQIWQQENKRWFLVSQTEGPFIFPPDSCKAKRNQTPPKEQPDGGNTTD